MPMGTLLVNILGCLVIGFIVGLSARTNIITEEMKLLFITGFCGGFTTFSAFSLENLNLWQTAQYTTVVFYILASVLLGIAAVGAGILLSRVSF